MKSTPLLAALGLALALATPALACGPAGSSPEALKESIKEAYDLDRQGEYKAAADKFKAILKAHPDSRNTHYLLANTYWRDNLYTDSRKSWETVLRMDGTDRWAAEARTWLKAHANTGVGAKVVTIAFKDGGKTKSRFLRPTSMAVSRTGNMYVADASARYILRVGTDGQLSIAAGSGKPGYKDGPARSATVTSPRALSLDAVGNMYFIDGNRVRFLTPNGHVGTLAGHDEAASRDGAYGTTRLNKPSAIAVDHKGVVYVAEGEVPTIRRITPNGDMTLFAGGSAKGYKDGTGAEAQFQQIEAMRVNPNGELLIADGGSNRIRRANVNGVVTTLTGCGKAGYLDGPVAAAHFRKVTGLVMDGQGNMYVADAGNNAVRQISAKDEAVRTLAGGAGDGQEDGVGIMARFGWPADVALVDNHLYVLDKKYATIRRVTLSD